MRIVPVESLENCSMQIRKGTIFSSLNDSMNPWYPYYGYSELIFFHDVPPWPLPLFFGGCGVLCPSVKSLLYCLPFNHSVKQAVKPAMLHAT